MDPDANLAEQRRIIACLIEAENPAYIATYGKRLADLVEALDNWITNGGFLPRAWSNANRR